MQSVWVILWRKKRHGSTGRIQDFLNGKGGGANFFFHCMIWHFFACKYKAKLKCQYSRSGLPPTPFWIRMCYAVRPLHIHLFSITSSSFSYPMFIYHIYTAGLCMIDWIFKKIVLFTQIYAEKVWDRWGSYGPCSRTCGGGVRSRQRSCLYQR